MEKKTLFKIILLQFLYIGLITQPIQAQTDSASFYLGGIKEWFYQQEDVFSFRKIDKTEYLGQLPANIVEKHEYGEDGLNYVYFKSATSATDRQSVISSIILSPDFEKEFMVLTKDLSSSFKDSKYIPTNDIIEVVFNDENISMADVNTFATNHFLELVYAPSYEGGVYIFRVHPEFEVDVLTAELTLERATEIWEQDMHILNKVVPSLGLFQQNSVNDSLYNEMWHAENNGIICFGTQGDVGASAKVNTVWNINNEFGAYQGYTGAGITVAVIDFDGFQYSHPDMQNVYLEGIGILTDSIFTFNNDFWYSGPSHGHSVSSIIAANADNNIGIAGVAFDAKIKPILMPPSYTNFTHELNKALMECINHKNEIDIINISAGTLFNGQIINAGGLALTETIKDIYLIDKNGIQKGIPIIVSAGNQNGYSQQLPAMYNETLSVGASTPRDRRKVATINSVGWGVDSTQTADGFDDFVVNSISGDTTFIPWGSSYFIDLDVVAPGVKIPALDLYFNNGTSTGLTYFDKTSAATPIVSGIAALLLEKEPGLTAEQVYNAIRNGAEKTGGYIYSDTLVYVDSVNTPQQTLRWYTSNTKHMEMGYGRVNAYNTVFNTDTTFNAHLDAYNPNITAINNLHNNFNYYHNNPCLERLNIRLSKPQNYSILIYDVNGLLLFNQEIENKSNLSISVKDFAKGVYFIQIKHLKTNSFVNSKFIKQ